MGCPTIKKAFEDSLRKNELANTDQVLVYDNGTIYNVTYGTFVSELGATGSLSSIGSLDATPVLTGVDSDYKLRAIKGGNGISTQVDGNGNILLNAQIDNLGGTQDGLAIARNTQSPTIGIRRLIGGQGIQISEDRNSLIIENTEIGVTNKTVIVNEINDFPDPIGGVITLSDNTAYLLANDISTSNRFVLGQNTVIFSNDPFICTLTYSGTGSMFTFVNGVQGIKEIGISCPNGTLFDSSNVTTGNLLVRWCLIKTVKNLGTLKHSNVGIYDTLIQLHTGQGFVYSNTVNARLKVKNLIFLQTTNNAATLIDLNGSTFDSLNISLCEVLSSVLGQTFLSGLPDGANLTNGTIGFVNNCNIVGSMVGLAGITSSDVGWDFTDCNKIADTEPRAQLHLSTPATTNVISSNTDYVISGVFVEDIASLFETNVNGRATYKGIRNKYVRVDTTISFEPVSGTNKDLTVGLMVNGVVQSETKILRRVSTGESAVVSIDWGFELSTNDFVEIVVSNNTDTTDIKVNQVLLRTA